MTADPTVVGSCVCGRPLRTSEWGGIEHADNGDPYFCYPDEAGLDGESRCTAMVDEEADDDR